MRVINGLLLPCALLIVCACGRADAADDDKPIAPLLKDLGDHHHKVTTASSQAQQFFDQGLRLVFGFNHAEAIRAFREAARLDPNCAMAYWGHALALGPNINAPMDREAEKQAYEVLQKAIQLKPKVSQVERDYIDALAVRYSVAEDADRVALDTAFADAMARLAQKYPDDLDAVTLYGEALMDLSPWNYWTKDGHAQPGTEKIVETLESVIARNDSHPGALHYYIHAVEASQTPGRAEAAADRLGKVMPGAGHLVHMPAHIYIRIGRYADASDANVRAIAADNEYITQCRSQGIYPLLYHPHNIHFLWAAASLEGRSEQALRAARKVASKVELEHLEMPGGGELQSFLIPPLYALTRFGKWDDILREPAPPANLAFPTGVWHYARGMAFAGQGKFDDAKSEHAQLVAKSEDESVQELLVAGANTAARILAVAAAALEGEIAARSGDTDQAIDHLELAVRLQDGLAYYEPPAWHYPVRQSLGAVLLEAGRASEAETVYWEDLRRTPENGWSLFGLMQSLRAQDRNDEADAIGKRFEKAWSRADVKLTSSRM